MSLVVSTVELARADPATLDYAARAALSITAEFPRRIALGMMRRTRTLIEGGHYRDGSVVHVFRSFIEQKHSHQRQIIDYLEAELIDVAMPSGYTAYFVLRWNGGREEFVLQAAPSE